jgi:hypothetical protein
MGMIGTLFGGARAARAAAEAVGGVADVLAGHRVSRDGGLAAALDQYGSEFAEVGDGPFDRFVNGLNRLPRPMLALGTLGLFVYAMAEPHGFSVRMEGLNRVPEPLWWLLGAVVSFYFGARELHHQRRRTSVAAPRGLPGDGEAAAAGSGAPATAPEPVAALCSRAAAVDPDRNPAVEEWRRLRA